MPHPQLLPFLYDAEKKLLPSVLYQDLANLERYLDCVQYEHRECDVDGWRASGTYGHLGRTTPWSERRIAPYNLLPEISAELTSWSLGGNNWCHVAVAGDDDATDWLTTVAEISGLAFVVAVARTAGGVMGTSAVSMSVNDGDFFFEAHRTTAMRVLEWADPIRHRPRAVVKIEREIDESTTDRNAEAWKARYWDETTASTWLRVRRDGRWVWILEAEVVHDLGLCPVWWCPNNTASIRHWGEPDVPKAVAAADDASELLAAASATTKRNADDTLVVKTDPKNNMGKPIRKGGFNVIFAEGGAEYLSQAGDSARVCVEISKERAAQLYRQAGMDYVDPANAGAQESGEARKQRYLHTAATAAMVRSSYARGLIVPICRGILQVSRRLGPARLNVPPSSGPDGTLRARTPGTSDFVTCSWPTQFPPTAADTQAVVTTAVAGSGNKQVMSRETAVKMLAANGAVPIDNVSEELERIEGDEEAAAERSAAALGLQADGPGAAGRIGEGDGADGKKKTDDDAAEE